MSYLITFSFLQLYCKNAVYNTYNTQNTCYSTDCVIGKIASQQ